MIRSPLAAALGEIGLNATEAALAAGCSPAAVSAANSGQPIPLALRMFLNQAGVDVCKLEAEQSEFREKRSSEIRSRVLNGRGGEIPVSTRCAAAGVTK